MRRIMFLKSILLVYCLIIGEYNPFIVKVIANEKGLTCVIWLFPT